MAHRDYSHINQPTLAMFIMSIDYPNSISKTENKQNNSKQKNVVAITPYVVDIVTMTYLEPAC